MPAGRGKARRRADGIRVQPWGGERAWELHPEVGEPGAWLGYRGRVSDGSLATPLARGVAAVAGAHRPLVQVIVVEFGVAAFYRVGDYANRLRERSEEAERLLAELRENRAAQVLAATLAERQRLAREMHDVLAHSLSG